MPIRVLVLLAGCSVLAACGGLEESEKAPAVAGGKDGQVPIGRPSTSPGARRQPSRGGGMSGELLNSSSGLPAFSGREVAAPDGPAVLEPPPDLWKSPNIDESRVQAEGIRQLQSARLTLYTDLPSQPAVDELPEVFDRAVPLWCQYFEIPAERASDWHMTASIMRDKDAFHRAGLLPESLPPFPHGYQHYAEMWVHEQPSDYYRRHLLLHEGTHAFMKWALGGAGPPWYMEGMAELLATHRWQNGELELGIFPQNRDETPYLGRIKIVREEAAAGRSKSLADIMQYDDRAHLQVEPYAWCWAAAVFFDGQSAYREKFRQLRSAVQWDGSQFSEYFQTAMAGQWPQIQRQWQLFVAELDYGYDLERESIPQVAVHPLSPEGEESRIDVARGWQSAGVFLEAGKRYRIEARGRYQLKQDPRWACEANGVTIRYCRGLPLGMLLGAIVDEEQALADAAPLLRPGPLGLLVETRPARGGTLYLRINDYPSELADNAGEVTVSVRPLPD